MQIANLLGWFGRYQHELVMHNWKLSAQVSGLMVYNFKNKNKDINYQLME
jgi:hypothetical protein